MASNGLGRRSKANNITFIGGIVGLAIYLLFGLLPSLLYGGYAGVVLANGIFGGPIHENALAQAMVALGVVSGALATGGVFVLGGAIVATGIYGTVSVLAASAANAQGSEPEPVESRID